MLHQLSMKSCGLAGEIPHWISTLKRLVSLVLSENQLRKENSHSGLLKWNFWGRFYQMMNLEVLFQLAFFLKVVCWCLLSHGTISLGSCPKTLEMQRSWGFLCWQGTTSPGLFLHPSHRFPNYYGWTCLETNYLATLSQRLTLKAGWLTSISLPMSSRESFQPHFLEKSKFLHWVETSFLGQQYSRWISKFSFPTLQPAIFEPKQQHPPRFNPSTLSYLSNLQILDVSKNNLTGGIPEGFGNFTGMIETPDFPASFFPTSFSINSISYVVVVAPSERYEGEVSQELNDLIVNWNKSKQGLSTHNLDIYTLLDSSNNQLSGKIPASLGALKALKTTLNISYYNYSTMIPNLKFIFYHHQYIYIKKSS